MCPQPDDDLTLEELDAAREKYEQMKIEHEGWRRALDAVMTASGAEEHYELAAGTVRQYLNRNMPRWARKDAGTWLVLASEATKVWGKS